MSISEERTDLFVSDKQLYDILDGTLNLLNPSKIKVYVPELDEYLKLAELIERIKKDHPKSISYKRALYNWIENLSHKYEQAKEEVEHLVRRLLLNKQDVINYNKAQDEQIEKLEKEIDYLKKDIIKRLERLPKDNTKQFIDTIKAKAEEKQEEDY